MISSPDTPRAIPGSAFTVDARDFPANAPMREQVLFLLRYAILAPSTHNTQPWKFAPHQHGVEVFADYTRRLPAVDPGSRELLMSVGAAIMNLRVAAAHFGIACRVDYDYSGGSERPLAMIALSPGDRPAAPPPVPGHEPLAALFPAITRRMTNRQPFLVSRVPAVVLRQLEAIAVEYQCRLVVSTDGKRNDQVADLVAQGDRLLLADPAYRRDVAEWIRADALAAEDGIPASALGLSPGVSPIAAWSARVLDPGTRRAAEDRNLCVDAPALITIAGDDTPPAFLEAGELLERVLLAMTLEGIQTSYFNMPMQVPELRLRLRSLLELPTWPQLLLRAGYSPTDGVRTARRPLEDMMVPNERVF